MQIVIATRDGRKTVPAYRVQRGLAVIRNGDNWSLTYLTNGMRVGPLYRTRKLACEALLELTRDLDWAVPEEVVLLNDHYREVLQRVSTSPRTGFYGDAE